MRLSADRRRRARSSAAVLVASFALASCFSGESGPGGSDALAQDCSTVKAALEKAKQDLAAASGKALSGGLQAVNAELRTIAGTLKESGAAIQDTELKAALDAAAGDIEKLGGSGGMPPAGADGGLAQLDQAVQRKCSSG
jgi:hypothetical protein